jgi:hypothetical protein
MCRNSEGHGARRSCPLVGIEIIHIHIVGFVFLVNPDIIDLESRGCQRRITAGVLESDTIIASAVQTNDS